MAQRVFLIQLPVDDLRLVSEAIKGSPAQRLDVAATLAEASAAHLRRVALSERMAAACAQGTNTDRWGYGQYCMPYLLAASTADEIVASLRRLEAIDSDAELVRFFHQQALQLGASLSQPPDREKYQAPPRDAVQRFIASQLDRAASLRQLAVSSPSEAHLTDFAVSTWVWLGRLFARLRPAFWEGRNRWLGGAAFAHEFTSLQTNVVTLQPNPTFFERIRTWFRGDEGLDPALAQLVAQQQDRTRQQLASSSAPELAGLLESTAALAPELGLPGWERALPREGGGNLVSGGVRHDALGSLVAAMDAMKARQSFPYETGAEWAELVIAAAREAQRAGAHLVEGDDSISGAYRWPPLDDEAD